MTANGSQSILSLPAAQNVVSTDEILIVFNAVSNSFVSNGSPSVRTITINNFSNCLSNNFVTTSGNYTLTGNNTFAGTNTVISSNLTVSGATIFNDQTNFSPIANLTYETTINWNVMTAQVAEITLSDTSTTMAAPTNLINGGTYILFIIQDSVGSRSIAWNSIFKWPNGIPPILTPTPNGIDIISFVSDGSNLYGSTQLNFK